MGELGLGTGKRGRYALAFRSTPLASVLTSAGSCCVVHGLAGSAPAGFEQSSPARAALEGTMSTTAMPLDCRMASKSAKKNVRFLMIGPPTAPPNWLRLKGAFGAAGSSKKFRASRVLLRR